MLSSTNGRAATVDLLDSQVRDAVRERGVDPLADRAAVRRIAQDVLGEHDRRSLSGAVPPVEDQAAVLDELLSRVAGFGPLQQYLDDPSVEEDCTIPRSAAGHAL